MAGFAVPVVRAQVEASYSSLNNVGWVAGSSGQERVTQVALQARAHNFAAQLAQLRTPMRRNIFSCAEPNAVANLLTIRVRSLDEIRIEFTTRGSEVLAPCANCAQWLEETSHGSRTYKIKRQFLPAAAPQVVPGMDQFPPLGS
jgi:hypothetical protein